MAKMGPAFTVVLVFLSSLAAAAPAPCQSDLYKSLTIALKPGDQIGTAVRYLQEKKVEFLLADDKLRLFNFAPGIPLPENFTLGINNKLRSNGFISRNEIMILQFTREVLQTVRCSVAATGP
jgi:hypothetical protein